MISRHARQLTCQTSFWIQTFNYLLLWEQLKSSKCLEGLIVLVGDLKEARCCIRGCWDMTMSWLTDFHKRPWLGRSFTIRFCRFWLRRGTGFSLPMIFYTRCHCLKLAASSYCFEQAKVVSHTRAHILPDSECKCTRRNDTLIIRNNKTNATALLLTFSHSTLIYAAPRLQVMKNSKPPHPLLLLFFFPPQQLNTDNFLHADHWSRKPAGGFSLLWQMSCSRNEHKEEISPLETWRTDPVSVSAERKCLNLTRL